MKLRISNNQWRIRVSKNDFKQLLNGKNIELVSKLPDNLKLIFTVSLSDNPAPHIEKQGHLYQITFPKNKVASITSKLPDKQGITFDLDTENEQFQLTFQMDVRRT